MGQNSIELKFKAGNTGVYSASIIDAFLDKYKELTGQSLVKNEAYIHKFDAVAKIDTSAKAIELRAFGAQKAEKLFKANTPEVFNKAKAELKTEFTDKGVFYADFNIEFEESDLFSDYIQSTIFDDVKPYKDILAESLSVKKPLINDAIAAPKLDSLYNNDAKYSTQFILGGTYAGNEVEQFTTAYTNYQTSLDGLSKFIEDNAGVKLANNAEVKATLEEYKTNIDSQQVALDALNGRVAGSDKDKIAHLKARLKVQSDIIKKIEDRGESIASTDLFNLSNRTLSISNNQGDCGDKTVARWGEQLLSPLAFLKSLWNGTTDLVAWTLPSYVKGEIAREKNYDNIWSGGIADGVKTAGWSLVAGLIARRLKIKLPSGKIVGDTKWFGGLSKLLGRVSTATKEARPQILDRAENLATHAQTSITSNNFINAANELDDAQKILDKSDHTGVVAMLKNLWAKVPKLSFKKDEARFLPNARRTVLEQKGIAQNAINNAKAQLASAANSAGAPPPIAAVELKPLNLWRRFAGWEWLGKAKPKALQQNALLNATTDDALVTSNNYMRLFTNMFTKNRFEKNPQVFQRDVTDFINTVNSPKFTPAFRAELLRNMQTHFNTMDNWSNRTNTLYSLPRIFISPQKIFIGMFGLGALQGGAQASRDAEAEGAGFIERSTYGLKNAFPKMLEAIAFAPFLGEIANKVFGANKYEGAAERKKLIEEHTVKTKSEIEKLELEKKAADLKNAEFRQEIIAQYKVTAEQQANPQYSSQIETLVKQKHADYLKALDAKIAHLQSTITGDKKTIALKIQQEQTEERVAAYAKKYQVQIMQDKGLLDAIKNMKSEADLPQIMEKLNTLMVADNPTQEDVAQLAMILIQGAQQEQQAAQPAEQAQQ